jgi:molecular chaperone GrpE
MADDNDKRDGNGPADPGAPTPEMETIAASVLEELRSAGAKAAEYLDLAKRTQADFVNYQARVRRDREEYSRYAAEGLLRDLLPVADDLQRLLASSSAAGLPALLEGVKLTERELHRILVKAGARPIETLGKKFDPAFHEAAETVDAPPGKAAGDIVEEVRRGYLLHDRVLRPASVKVARAADKGQAAQGL